MAEAPIDPLTLMHALVSAWNRGQSRDVQNVAPPAPPLAPVQAPATADLVEIGARLARIEESLLRLEALVAAGVASGADTGKRKRSRRN